LDFFRVNHAIAAKNTRANITPMTAPAMVAADVAGCASSSSCAAAADDICQTVVVAAVVATEVMGFPDVRVTVVVAGSPVKLVSVIVVRTVMSSKRSATDSWRALRVGPLSMVEVGVDDPDPDSAATGSEVVNAVTVLHTVDVEVLGTTMVV